MAFKNVQGNTAMNHVADTTLAIAKAVLAPPFKQLGLEPFRAVMEYAGMRLMDRRALPRGDGHPVIVFPGLCSDPQWVGPVLSMCTELGYAARGWGRGLNTGPRGDVDEWLAGLSHDIGLLLRKHRQRATLVGWSLGGVYAREVAKHLGPDRIRQVVSIGSPFAGEPEHTNASLLYRLLNGSRPMLTDALRERLKAAPPVPTTSIYSRTDGVVAWQACIQGACRHPHIENVEVDSSHCGLGWNARVLRILADRLAQPVGAWRPYQAPEQSGFSPAAAAIG
jgi:hypothetical protein